MSGQLKKLAVSLISILILLFIIDRGGAMVMREVTARSEDMISPKMRFLADSCDTDILIVGTSRANCHYIPDSIAKVSGMTVYNGGIDGSDNIFSHYFILSLLTERHKPSIILLEIMPADFLVKKDSFSKLGFFAPYLGRSEAGDSVFMESGKYNVYKLFHLLRYNSKAISNIGGLLKSSENKDYSGFFPLPCKSNEYMQLRKEESSGKIDSLKIKYIDKFVKKCDENGINLIFTISPCYSLADDSLYFPIKEYAEKHRIKLLDYHSSCLFHDKKELFHDNLHLNETGAKKFMEIFTRDIKYVLKR